MRRRPALYLCLGRVRDEQEPEVKWRVAPVSRTQVAHKHRRISHSIGDALVTGTTKVCEARFLHAGSCGGEA